MNIIKRIFVKKEGKSLLANMGYLSLLQIANYVFPLITLPYLAKTIGVEGFGKIAFAGAVILWIQTITDWGFNYSATRDIARIRSDNESVSEIFSNVFWSRCFLMLLSLGVLLILIFLIPIFRKNALIILISFLLVPGHIAFPEYFFQAMEDMKYITILNVVSKLVFTLAVFLIIKDESDYWLQPFLSALGYIIAGGIAFFFIIKKWKIRIKKPNLHKILITIKGSTDVFISNIIPNIYNSFSVIILGVFGGATSNGIFDAGNKFITVGHQTVNIISRSFFPSIARKVELHKMYAKFCVGAALLITILLFAFAPLLIRLFFTEEFSQAIVVLQIKSVCVFFVALNRVYGINYLLIIGKEKILRNVNTICSIFGLAIMFPLVYFYSYIGAAITIAITQGLIGTINMIIAKNNKV